MKGKKVMIIGGAVADVSVIGADEGVFVRPSTPVPSITLSTGGDAMNEARGLARLGTPVSLLTVLGEDDMGAYLRRRCEELGIDLTWTVTEPDVSTSINVVLVDPQAQRRFITMEGSSLRRLAPHHLRKAVETLTGEEIVSFASIFVSPCLGVGELEELFAAIKARGCTLCADMTRCKNGETARDMAPALRFVDYLFPNEEEAALLTGKSTPEDAAAELVAQGVGHVVMTLGSRGSWCAGGRKPFSSRPAAANGW